MPLATLHQPYVPKNLTDVVLEEVLNDPRVRQEIERIALLALSDLLGAFTVGVRDTLTTPAPAVQPEGNPE